MVTHHQGAFPHNTLKTYRVLSDKLPLEISKPLYNISILKEKGRKILLKSWQKISNNP